MATRAFAKADIHGIYKCIEGMPKKKKIGRKPPQSIGKRKIKDTNFCIEKKGFHHSTRVYVCVPDEK